MAHRAGRQYRARACGSHRWVVVPDLAQLFVRWMERSDHIDPIVEIPSSRASSTTGCSAILLSSPSSPSSAWRPTSLVAVLGAASLAIGLALQGSLTSLAAGVMIILLRPFQIGDYIEVDDKAGTVKSITLFLTELATYDNVQKLMPNSEVWGTAVTNYSVYQTRLLDIGVGIDYADIIDRASRPCAGLRRRTTRCSPSRHRTPSSAAWGSPRWTLTCACGSQRPTTGRCAVS